MKPKPYSYYTVDSGFYNAPVKLCFSVQAFNDILKDHNINTKETALSIGVAECHYFTENKAALIILVFDFDELENDEDMSNIFATIVHESCHCVRRIFEYIGACLLYTSPSPRDS